MTGPTSANAEQHKPVVNWDVVGDNASPAIPRAGAPR